MGQMLEVNLTNDLAEIPMLTESVERYCADAGVSPAVVFHIVLALDEFITNVVSYAYDDRARHSIRVTLNLADGRLTTEIEDDGRPFDPLSRPDPDISASLEDREVGGLGTYLIKQVMDEVTYHRSENRNRLSLVKRL
ncbi:serine/threonine-protein kinase RsbW [uncultured Gammaproteobacteria bacterium]